MTNPCRRQSWGRFENLRQTRTFPTGPAQTAKGLAITCPILKLSQKSERGVMSKELVTIQLSSNGPILWAEAESESWEGQDAFGRVADPVKALAQAPKTVEDALDLVVVPAAQTFMDRLRTLSPDAVEFEFG